MLLLMRIMTGVERSGGFLLRIKHDFCDPPSPLRHCSAAHRSTVQRSMAHCSTHLFLKPAPAALCSDRDSASSTPVSSLLMLFLTQKNLTTQVCSQAFSHSPNHNIMFSLESFYCSISKSSFELFLYLMMHTLSLGLYS